MGPKSDILPGTLYMLILRSLARMGPMHGYGIAQFIQQRSDDVLQVEEGSLYPALHRMEQSGWVASSWGLTATNRKAKYYKLTAVGRKQLRAAEADFEHLVRGVRAILHYA